jgi:RecA/RadA recombinase
MRTSEIKRSLRRRVSKRVLTASDFVSTGSTLLNLACTGYPFRGFAKGYYYFLVGDSISGKTFLSLTCLAEAAINKNFKDHRFIYDNSEGGALMNISRFFGKQVASRIEAPCKDKDGSPIYSTRIEEFYFHMDDAFRKKQPFIYILDSMDSLSSEEEQKKFAEQKRDYRKGKALTGAMTDGKARKNSTNIRQLLTPLNDTGSILLVINQTRANLGMGHAKRTRSGGWALRFYATIEMWSRVKEDIERQVKGKKRQIGILGEVKIVKNRHTGRQGKVEIPIYHSYGIDDIGSCIDYLVDEGHWKMENTRIIAPEFKIENSRNILARRIDEMKEQNKLRKIVGNVWNDIEKACELNRNPRYV